MMKYELPKLPEPLYKTHPLNKPDCYSEGQMEEYAEQAVAPLLAEIEELREKFDAALCVIVDLGGEIREPEMAEIRSLKQDANRYRWLRNSEDSPIVSEGQATDKMVDRAIEKQSQANTSRA